MERAFSFFKDPDQDPGEPFKHSTFEGADVLFNVRNIPRTKEALFRRQAGVDDLPVQHGKHVVRGSKWRELALLRGMYALRSVTNFPIKVAESEMADELSKAFGTVIAAGQTTKFSGVLSDAAKGTIFERFDPVLGFVLECVDKIAEADADAEATATKN